MDDESGAGGGGGQPGHLAIYDYEALRDAVMADSPDALNHLVITWKQIAWAVDELGGELIPVIAAARDAYDSPHGAPAFFGELDKLQRRINDLALDLHNNAEVMNQADLALRSAQNEMTRLEGDGTRKMVDLRTGKDVRAAEAGSIAYALNDTYGSSLDNLVVPSEDRPDIDRPGSPPGPSGSPSGPAVAYVTSPPPLRAVGGTSPGQRSATGPALGGNRQPSGGSAAPAPPPTSGPAGSAPGRRSSGTVDSRAGSAPGNRTQAPGARAGGPLGGSRIPVARGGSLGGTGGGGSSPGQAAPGSGPAKGSNVPPAGMPGQGGGGGGGGRRGRRLSWYERIEDEFVDHRFGNPPGGTIGADRIQSKPADPGPAVLGSQKYKAGDDPAARAETLPETAALPHGFPDTLENGSFTHKDGTRFQVRRRGNGA